MLFLDGISLARDDARYLLIALHADAGPHAVSAARRSAEGSSVNWTRLRSAPKSESRFSLSSKTPRTASSNCVVRSCVTVATAPSAVEPRSGDGSAALARP